MKKKGYLCIKRGRKNIKLQNEVPAIVKEILTVILRNYKFIDRKNNTKCKRI